MPKKKIKPCRPVTAYPTKEEMIQDLLDYADDKPNISRNYYRSQTQFSEIDYERYFGTFSEFKKAAGLEPTRQQKKIVSDISRHASLDMFRNYYKEEILPYHNKYVKKESSDSNLKSILIGTDFHDLDCNRFALHVFIDTAKRMQPDIISLGGDIFDLFEFSRFDSDIRNYKITERFDFVKKQIFEPLRKACPKAQIDFIIGNHEFRLLKFLSNKAPEIRILLSDVMGLGFKDVFGLDKYQINLISRFDLSAYNKSDIDKEIKQNYKIYYDCFAVCHEINKSLGISGCSGHLHKTLMSFDRNIPSGNISWVQTGTMCELEAEYTEKFTKWNMGFNIVNIDVKLKQVIQNPITIHPEWCLVNGILYRNKK